MAPRITVVTPSRDSVGTIEDCIRSVLDQEYPDLEYIVVDGASSDGTTDVIRRYEDRLSWWVSEPDGGQSDALNKGFRRATGDLVCWLNSDDFFYPGALLAAADAFREAPDSPFHFGNGYRVDRDGRKLAEFFPDGVVLFDREATVFGLNCVLQPATFIRRAGLEHVSFLDEALHYGFDTDLWIKLAELGAPHPIRRHLAASREYRETKTASGSFPRAEELRRLAEHYAGIEATPGSVAYYLDTLHRLAASRPDVFPEDYLPAIREFWGKTAALFRNHGARPDGFPDGLPARRGRTVLAPRPKEGRLRVGIELRQVTRGPSGGIVVVLEGTLRELFRRRRDIDFVVFSTVFNRELLESDDPNVEVLTLPLDGYFRELARIAALREVDVLVRSYPTVETVRFPLERQIFLIPDLQHEFRPEFFDERTLAARRDAFAQALTGGGAIMTISEHARETIRRHAIGETDVFVASPSLPPAFLNARPEDASRAERALVPDRPFFYFPANLWPHKNHERVFRAFRMFLDRTGLDYELVLTGSPRGWERLREANTDLPVRHLGFVSTGLVRLLYDRAAALVFCTQYEGFGIPVLEAFHCGTPVVCSNTTSLPEIAGDAALMCDPDDPVAICEQLERIAKDEELRSELVERGRRRVAAYDWERAAESLHAGIERLLERARRPLAGQPLVSIVTPSFDQGRFIAATIDSVLAQTYSNIEYLVVDGGSTDQTLDVLRGYGDRVRWISEPDRGQADAINKGMAQVNGEIRAYLNSDDVLLPDAVETVVEYFRSHPLCDLVYGDADYIDADGQVTGAYATAEYSFERLMDDCCICQPAAFWRARVSETVGPFDQTLQYAMDYDYWLRTDRCGLVIEHVSETLAQSRLYPETKTLSARRDIYREIFAICRARGGYVSRNYVSGFWEHLAVDGPLPLRFLSRAPRLRRLVSELHYLVVNRRLRLTRPSALAVARRLRRIAVRMLSRTPRLRRAAARAERRARAAVARPGRPALAVLARPNVTGYWADNWVGGTLQVQVGQRETGRRVRFVGWPVDRMDVEFALGDVPLDRFPVERGLRAELEVEVAPGPEDVLSVSFSQARTDGYGRQLSFLLEETNLFAEEDLAPVA